MILRRHASIFFEKRPFLIFKKIIGGFLVENFFNFKKYDILYTLFFSFVNVCKRTHDNMIGGEHNGKKEKSSKKSKESQKGKEKACKKKESPKIILSSP